MKLNIFNDNTHSIPEKLGVSKHRREQLYDFVENLVNSIEQGASRTPLVKYYAIIAEQCENIEEYTMCMHTFIFNLAKIGKPVDSKDLQN